MKVDFRTISPFPTGFSLTADAITGHPDSYHEYWQSVSQNLGTLFDGVSFRHTKKPSNIIRYQTLKRDSLERPLEIIKINCSADSLNLVPPEGTEHLWAGVKNIECQICNHFVAILQMEGSIEIESSDIERLDHVLENESNDTLLVNFPDLSEDLAQAVTTALREKIINPLLAQIFLQKDTNSYLIDSKLKEVDAPPWWTSRILYLNMDDPSSKKIARFWLRDSADRETIDSLCEGNIFHVSYWLNHVHHSVSGNSYRITKSTDSALRAMLYTQFFYAALDQVDDRLNIVLAETIHNRRQSELTKIEGSLKELSHRAEKVIVDRQELLKYVTKDVRTIFNEIMHQWEFKELVENPVRYKITICDRRLAELNNDAVAKSNTITDVILLGIAVTSILGTALALSSFGRSIATDPLQAGYGSTTSNWTEWFAAQPADSIVVGSLAISLILLILFLIFRRRS